MKIPQFILFFILFQLIVLAKCKPAGKDSVRSLISGEKILPNGQKTGKISEAFWNLELKTMDGKILRMKDYKGKYVYLNFWGEWCPGCREEMPSIVEAYKKYKNRAEFIGLLKPHNLENAKKFINEQKMTFPIVILQKELKSRFKFDGFPLSILIFPDGKTYLRADEVNKIFFSLNIK